MEALVRWNSDKIIYPSDFIPLAEETGLIMPLGEWILIKVFEQMKAEGFDCSEEMIRRQSPLISDRINFVGKYTFRYEDELSNGKLRPLNVEEF